MESGGFSEHPWSVQHNGVIGQEELWEAPLVLFWQTYFYTKLACLECRF